MNSVDANFFDTMGMPLLAGRKFDERIGSDHALSAGPSGHVFTREELTRNTNVVMSESAANTLGFTKPQAAIGKELKAMGPPLTIVGVVKDARFRSVRNPVDPIAYKLGTDNLTTMMVRYDAPDPGRITTEIERAWRRVIPTLPVKVEYVDDRLREMYRPDEARGRLFGAFALVAVVIGCLGLFGLAAFTAERRTKEIGIRKVLGAKTQDIVRLLAWQFSKPVVIANLIAWPVAWWLMRRFLNSFDARIALSPAYFVLAGTLALVIAIATIAGHAFKVARAQPVHALRYE
jgi:putative ABC transport system permease protein